MSGDDVIDVGELTGVRAFRNRRSQSAPDLLHVLDVETTKPFEIRDAIRTMPHYVTLASGARRSLLRDAMASIKGACREIKEQGWMNTILPGGGTKA